MRIGVRRHILLFALLTYAALALSDGSDAATAMRNDVQVVGVWDASFSGTVKRTGTSQTDTLVIELQQNGSRVMGTLRFAGLDVSFPVSGTVSGETLRYNSKVMVGPSCEASVVAEVIVDAATGRFSGSQTQSNCEGTAVGKVTAVRRSDK